MLNVKFLRKTTVFLTFLQFSLTTYEGVNFLVKIFDVLMVLSLMSWRKFHMFDWCITDNILLLKKFSTESQFAIENATECEISV